MEYLRSLLKGRPNPHASHNPLGALMAVALWFVTLALALSGYLMRLDALWGEDWPQNLHYWLAVALQICVGLHIVAAIVMSVWTRENLIASMVTGVRRARK
jgi:cytochrome b